METLSLLYQELRRLPRGNVYKKVIAGKTYFYHQYFQQGKRYSRLVPKEEIEALREAITRRKEIERLIAAKQGKAVTLSPSAKALTGTLMNGNDPVATFQEGVLTWMDEQRAPLSVKRTHSLETFLSLRVLDMSRTNARILKKILHIDVEEDYKAALYTYALSVYDRYWFKPKHSKLTYDGLALRSDALFDTSLKGEINVFYGSGRLSPELTTVGSFEKGWRYLDGTWWLYKSGNPAQIFSELFCSAFARLIGVPTVSYEYEEGYIRCPNFSPETNFEPIAALAGSNEDYGFLFSMLLELREDLAKEYLRLSFFDAVVNNVDRHNENLGLLRDPSTSHILSLAPNFDDNLALVATSPRLNDNPTKDGFMNLFARFIESEDEARRLFLTLSFPAITLEQIQGIVDAIPIDIEGKEAIASAVLSRYDGLLRRLNK